MTSTITIPGTTTVSNDLSPTGLLSLATLFGAGPMIPTTLKAAEGHLSTEAPEAFAALQKCNTAAEGIGESRYQQAPRQSRST